MNRLVLALLIAGLHHPLDPRFLPPSFRGMEKYGCDMALRTDPENPHARWWHLKVYVVFPEKPWATVFSIRPEKERAKSLEDCNRWMDGVHESISKKK